MKKTIFGLTLVAILLWAAVFNWPDNRLRLVFCDVGQGDAILATYRTTQVLIDGGPNDKVLTCLGRHLPFWDRQIELVISTHPEADHLTGLVSVIERYNVKQIISNSLVADSGVFGKFREEVIAKKIPVFSPKDGDKIKIAKLAIKILWPETARVLGLSSFGGKLNEASIVAQLSFGDFDALLTGDIGFATEEKLVLNPVEVLKVAHHGSKYSTSEKFLEAIRPALAVVSVGKNAYGHPTQEVIERVSRQGIKLLRTDQDGEIEIVSDGQSWYTQTK